ncbi:MAG: YdcF family protein, partial [Bacteroidetes bacterium]|nr:YdcF family protein [Bacteroidota bacterium]
MKKFLKIFMVSMGGMFTLIIILAFTSGPFWLWYDLSVSKAGVNRPPDYIIVLGGGGMPSESGLMRCWYAAKAANYFTRSKVIIALPGKIRDSLSSINGMKKELTIRGIAAERILLEDSGTNTRAEALNILKICTMYNVQCTNSGYSDLSKNLPSLLIVSSPEHIYRAVLTFKKAGFTRVDAIPAFEEALESDLSFQGRRLGGRRWVPDIGNNITLRYQFWTQ